MAVASGVIIIATASSENHSFVRNLGVAVVVDYHAMGMVEKLVTEVKGLAAVFPGDLKGSFVGALDAVADEDKTWKV